MRRAIVTGGQSGIGAACITRLRRRRSRYLLMPIDPPTSAADVEGLVAIVNTGSVVAHSLRVS